MQKKLKNLYPLAVLTCCLFLFLKSPILCAGREGFGDAPLNTEKKDKEKMTLEEEEEAERKKEEEQKRVHEEDDAFTVVSQPEEALFPNFLRYNFPLEMSVIIWSYFSISEQLSLSSICKAWFVISLASLKASPILRAKIKELMSLILSFDRKNIIFGLNVKPTKETVKFIFRQVQTVLPQLSSAVDTSEEKKPLYSLFDVIQLSLGHSGPIHRISIVRGSSEELAIFGNPTDEEAQPISGVAIGTRNLENILDPSSLISLNLGESLFQWQSFASFTRLSRLSLPYEGMSLSTAPAALSQLLPLSLEKLNMGTVRSGEIFASLLTGFTLLTTVELTLELNLEGLSNLEAMLRQLESLRDLLRSLPNLTLFRLYNSQPELAPVEDGAHPELLEQVSRYLVNHGRVVIYLCPSDGSKWGSGPTWHIAWNYDGSDKFHRLDKGF